jgi:hypothetical protein
MRLQSTWKTAARQAGHRPQLRSMQDHICPLQTRAQTLPWLNLCSGLLNDLLATYVIARSKPSIAPKTQKSVPNWSVRRGRMQKLELPLQSSKREMRLGERRS